MTQKKYAELVKRTSDILKGIYWTKNHRFSGALAFYSDPIDDYYWTLVRDITSSEETIGNLVKEVEEYFKRLGKQFSFYLFPNELEKGVGSWLEKYGYEKVFEDAWMFYEGDYSFPEVSGKIEIREVKTDEENEKYIDVYTQAYETNPDDVYFDFGSKGIYQDIYRKTWKNGRLRKKMYRFLGFNDGKVACNGALYFKDGLGVISEVGTDPKYRRKGVAIALSNECLKAAKEEGCLTILLGTEKDYHAFSLYEKLGFRYRMSCVGYSKKT